MHCKGPFNSDIFLRMGTILRLENMSGLNENMTDMIDHDRSSEIAAGNTESAARKQGNMYRYWCFTLNNYENRDIDHLDHLLQKECEWFIFQEEVGENGTPHLQGTLCLKVRLRLTSLKCIDPRIHWEPTRSVTASIVYCQKQETRSGQQKVYGIEIPKKVKVHEPRGWQLEVIDIISQEADERTIHWFWDHDGNVGKTQLTKYLVVEHGANIVGGKKEAIAMACARAKKREIFIVNIPRKDYDYVNYGAIEQLKDGLIFSGRYETAQVVFDCPHVIVFANKPPDIDAMSMDRWNIKEIVTD